MKMNFLRTSFHGAGFPEDSFFYRGKQYCLSDNLQLVLLKILKCLLYFNIL